VLNKGSLLNMLVYLFFVTLSVPDVFFDFFTLLSSFNLLLGGPIDIEPEL